MTTLINSKQSKKEKWFEMKYEHLIAGLSGGIISTVILHPLDVIKIRFAVNDGRMNTIPKYNGIINAFKTIHRQEGFRGLYKGVMPNIIGAGASWGLYFFFYNAIKLNLQKGNINTKLSAGTHLFAASQAGFVTLLITNPIWIVKTRLCLQYDSTYPAKYSGTVDCLVKIYQADGLKGYYKGLLPGIVGVSHGAVQFMVYEELKKINAQINNQSVSTQLGTAEYLTFAATSKLIAAALTYPYQVIRARLQNQYHVYNGSLECIKMTWNYEGWRGFYKGLGTNLVRVTPATMITFLTYENVSYLLLRYNEHR